MGCIKDNDVVLDFSQVDEKNELTSDEGTTSVHVFIRAINTPHLITHSVN